MINKIIKKIKVLIFRRIWRKNNKHNFTTVKNIFDINYVKVGKATYGNKLSIVIACPGNNLVIGNFCSIANQVEFILSGEHNLNTASTYPYKAKFFNQPEAGNKGDIIIDDDVWIGYRAMIMSGVHIGQGAVIAAGAVVTKNVPPYAIVGGVPARVIRYRFSREIINVLMQLDFSKLAENTIKENIDELYREINTVEDAERIVDKLTLCEENK